MAVKGTTRPGKTLQGVEKMSQAKVDKYKEQKKNRDKIMKREKRERILAEVIVCAIVVVLIGWAGYSFYQNHKPTVVNTYTVDGTALDDYMSELNAETETGSTAEAEESTDAAESESETATASKETAETAAETAAETESAGKTESVAE